MPGKVPAESEVLGYIESQSNWGRWGPEDQLGTLNLLTPERRVRVAREVWPHEYRGLREPIHQIGIVHLGLWLMDNVNLEELAAACEQRSQWEFLFIVTPLRIANGTGSPINPIAMF